jgi:hypothetical protein
MKERQKAGSEEAAKEKMDISGRSGQKWTRPRKKDRRRDPATKKTT